MATKDLSGIPRTRVPDASLSLLRDGYVFISSTCDRLQTDVFRTRLMLKRAFCVRGAGAAELFYGSGLFSRKDAMPPTVVHLLQDYGSVQMLDGHAHAERKRLFLALLEADGIRDFTATLAEVWEARAARIAAGERIELYTELNRMLTEAALRWLGLPATQNQVRLRSQELSAMVDHAGTTGPHNAWARMIRRRSERWAAQVIALIRSGDLTPRPGRPADLIARHTEEGRPLSTEVAAVELLNVVRPIVANARFVVFAALALWQHPQWRQEFARGDLSRLEPFVQEVRRFYPFFPLIGGRSVRPFTWRGYAFPEQSWVLLDLYGTNHDPRSWSEPGSFRPERFVDREPTAYDLVPQGGGPYETGHRCPGERLTIATVETMVRLLSLADYTVPAQDLTYTMRAMPALPRSGLIVSGGSR
ncbi:cytochrome P450 [Nocardiopsis kunsanensis]|uniref:Cytochrome P450 n=1 Tax=Nocardiopsis kunsanensis TaxID=141693 RepID=A0A918XAH1_9ACTN|nr:cytochrome P450 [Nocardiopsis kunsanensis]GHD21735.1 cytochrome P450 [Nocardiopsis kunsanensis]